MGEDNQTIEYSAEANYIIPLWRQILWIVLFAIIPVVGATGNFIVVWIVVAHKRMRTVTNLFIVNLAISDGLVAAFDVPVMCYEMISSDWQFGNTYCKFNEGLAAINICVSMLMLSMISIDRYVAIMYPFRRRMKKTTAISIIILIWCTSLVITCPNWIYATVSVRAINATGKITHWCSQVWPHNHLELIYRIGFMLATYFLPLTCMAYTYSNMALQLWGAKWISAHTVNHVKNLRSTKKLVKMMIIIVVTFAVCWLPFQILFLVISSGLITEEPVFIREIYLFTFWFAMSNSMYNPILYCWMNAKFRAGFKRVLQCMPFVRHDTGRYKVHFSCSDTKSTPVYF